MREARNKLRKKWNIPNKKVILGVANIWSERKGLQDFCRLQNCIDDDYIIVLVGIDDAQKKILPEQIMCIPQIRNVSDLAELYFIADVYFNASIEETMGLTTIEALLCNTPVVVYNKTALPEIVPPEGGIILEPGNIQRVKEAIDKLINRNEPMINLCELKLKYGKDTMHKRYLGIYQNLTGEK